MLHPLKMADSDKVALLKDLGYPYTISEITPMNVGGGHAWPKILHFQISKPSVSPFSDGSHSVT